MHGPHAVTAADIPALNRLFADAFTERYRRDGMGAVRVPPLNPDIWMYAVQDAGDGAMLWRDAEQSLVAFNVAHRSGTEGWMGPLAVRTDQQGLGLGRMIVQEAITRLRDARVTTLGLETMPRTVDNIGFYSRLGFLPGCLTITLGRDVPSGVTRGAAIVLSQVGKEERAALVAGCRICLQAAAPGYDFTREIALTAELKLGDTVVVTEGGVVRGFAMWHSAPLAEARRADELRVLKLFAPTPAVLLALIQGVESVSRRLRIGRVAVRCQGRFTDAYAALIDRGYAVRWTDLRMTLVG
ncbi:MAG: GNAT family N-acetyltransferase, partial [Gemmatimonadota bacterium]|nr:GNAT family N-acetyltransferase [Gemmatimonadota bacterium]